MFRKLKTWWKGKPLMNGLYEGKDGTILVRTKVEYERPLPIRVTLKTLGFIKKERTTLIAIASLAVSIIAILKK